MADTRAFFIGFLMGWAITVFGYLARNHTLKDYKDGLLECVVKEMKSGVEP